MEQIKIENLSFKYPLSDKNVLDNISFNIYGGEFILLCGKSGCGKTTLLKHLKRELTPHGEMSGNILFDGENINALSARESAEKIGFVMQNPDSQIVTDKVWHELSFGLENLGLDGEEIQLRTAEMSSYFGLNDLYNKKTDRLSGGQKQLLNLACVMAMHPDVLLLDEPTSQLDPVSAETFIHMLTKINRELGITVILTEQRLEEALVCADRVAVMENGKIIFDGTPVETGENLKKLPEFLQISAPTAMRIFNDNSFDGKCPVTVRDGRNMLKNVPHSEKFTYIEKEKCEKNAVELKNICFRYEKNSRDILKNLSLKIPENSFFAVLGGNGAGKTTLLRIISSALLPYDGKIKIFGEKYKKSSAKIVVLPQTADAVFTAETVRLDLMDIQKDEKKISDIVSLVKLDGLTDRHPCDLSGGEQQRAALAKALLCEPDILLLDEPTKGMDAEFKADFAKIISSLNGKGCTVIMISHDIEFCAKYADFCTMLFDGEIAAVADSHRFFNNNRFYTTAANRMARGIIENAVTDGDINLCLKEK